MICSNFVPLLIRKSFKISLSAEYFGDLLRSIVESGIENEYQLKLIEEFDRTSLVFDSVMLIFLNSMSRIIQSHNLTSRLIVRGSMNLQLFSQVQMSTPIHGKARFFTINLKITLNKLTTRET